MYEKRGIMSLPHAILGLLTYMPLTGYDLKQVFDSSINHFWSAHQSQIYRELATLERKEYVSSQVEPQEKRPDRKVYSITAAGEQELQHWLERFPPVLTIPVREELLIRIFFASRLPLSELKFQLQRFLKEQQEKLTSYGGVDQIIGEQSQIMGLPDESFYWRLTLKLSLASAKARIQWAEECIKEIEAWESDLGEQDGKAVDQAGNTGKQQRNAGDREMSEEQ
jgi:DNA-binding PadR family transcriptional regulator